MKAEELFAKIRTAMGDELRSPAAWPDHELQPHELGNLKWAVARVFNQALAESLASQRDPESARGAVEPDPSPPCKEQP